MARPRGRTRSSARRGPTSLLWAVLCLATGAGTVALGVTGIVQASSLLAAGGPDGPAGFATSPVGIRTVAVMAACIVALGACAAMALLGLPSLFGVRWSVLLFAIAVAVGFASTTAMALLGLPESYTDPVSRYAIDHNGQPMSGTLAVCAAILMIGFVLALALTRSLYRHALRR